MPESPVWDKHNKALSNQAAAKSMVFTNHVKKKPCPGRKYAHIPDKTPNCVPALRGFRVRKSSGLSTERSNNGYGCRPSAPFSPPLYLLRPKLATIMEQCLTFILRLRNITIIQGWSGGYFRLSHIYNYIPNCASIENKYSGSTYQQCSTHNPILCLRSPRQGRRRSWSLVPSASSQPGSEAACAGTPASRYELIKSL